MNRSQLQLLFAGFALLVSTAVAAQADIEFDNIWIAEAPPGSQVMAAYMDIKNTGDRALQLSPPQSDDFKKIEFHRTFHENGMARMQQQSEIAIPAHETVKLEPGSYHMMLFNPARKLKAGDESTLIFQISNDNTIRITAVVKKAVFKQSGDHSDHSHH